MFISIDQNSNSLWDVLPKVEAMAYKSLSLTHLVEDIDVAFTSVGNSAQPPTLTVEQYYPSGNLDWGASLFYMDFLGRLPLNLIDLSQYTGIKVAQTAKALNLSVAQLYQKYAVADNVQLTGSSYTTSQLQHRLLGDLKFDEIKPFVLELLDLAESDVLHKFIDTDSQTRTKLWFASERKLLHATSLKTNTLSGFYCLWLKSHQPDCSVELTSTFFSQESIARFTFELLQKIANNYECFKNIYNESIKETGVELSLLQDGDLPFFVAYESGGQKVRSGLSFTATHFKFGDVKISRRCSFETFFEHSDVLVGKALLLVILARTKEIGAPLVLPELGSLYTPAAHCLCTKMIDHGFLDQQPYPITRLQFNFLSQLEHSESIIRVPKHLRLFFDEEVEAKTFSRRISEVIALAGEQLEQLKDQSVRTQVFSDWTPELSAELLELHRQKEQFGREASTRHKCIALWPLIKEKEAAKALHCYERLVDLVQVSEMGYWNSRGAITPWSVAAGGKPLYQKVLSECILREEHS